MKVKRAAKYGFCSGVRIADLKVKRFAAGGGRGAILGQVVHNERVVEEMERLGVRTVESIAAVPTLLTELAEETLCRQWLPALAAGELGAGLTYPPHLPLYLLPEVWLGPALIERVPRLRGRHKSSINYRHVIDWLVRKPGAFAAASCTFFAASA